MQRDTRCSVCYAEWNEAELKKAGVIGCPHCKTRVQTMKISHDGFIQINWQDLRVLAIYATRWMSLHDKEQNLYNREADVALANILNKLSRYRPKDGATIVPDIDVGKVPIEIVQMIRNIGKPKQEKPEFDFNINNQDLKPNEEGKIPSPFIKKKK